LRYPDDDVAIIKKAKKPEDQVGGEVEWRVKCADCPGKIYTLGPGETLSNFEVHLKNRAHIEKRQARAGRL
jgi:SWI/SNF-related matrix-associated actin-dependent regulator of chromatin subfamily B protein 1